jgi:hypothetical protein
MTGAAKAVGLEERPPKRPRRGVSLGLVALLFMLLTPVGLAVAWWHPAFREGKKRDPLLVLAVVLYLAMIAYVVTLGFFEE